MGMVRIKDIATRVGLASSTVSAVLSGRSYCYASAAKKQEILAAAAALGYVPNRMSRGIRGFSTDTIGIISSLFSIPVMSLLLKTLNDRLTAGGYVTMLGDSTFVPEVERKLIAEFLSRGVDGLLIRTTLSSAELDEIIQGRVPYVAFDHEQDGINITMRRADGAFLAVEHLIKVHGHHRIGLVRGDGGSNPQKEDGYRRALVRHGIKLEPDWIMHTDWPETDNIAGKIIANRLTAVFCINDFIARRVISDLGAAGKRVPEDIAVVGFDGLDMICDLVSPSLTSVRQPVASIAEVASDLLLRKIKREAIEDKSYILEPMLRIGRSCGCGAKF